MNKMVFIYTINIIINIYDFLLLGIKIHYLCYLLFGLF